MKKNFFIGICIIMFSYPLVTYSEKPVISDAIVEIENNQTISSTTDNSNIEKFNSSDFNSNKKLLPQTGEKISSSNFIIILGNMILVYVLYFYKKNYFK